MKKITLLLALCLFLCGCESKTEVQKPPEEIQQEVVVEAAPEPEPEPEPLVVTLAMCGDVMSHMPVTNDVKNEEYSYARILAGAVPYVSAADYAVANFETTMAGGPNYSGYPCFNSPDGLAYSLKEAGFDLMLTANNHSLDKGVNGVVRTLDVMDQVGLAHVGTSRTQEERDNNVYVADVGGVSVAFLGYTYGTNGIPLPQKAPYAVNVFNTDYMTSLSNPDWDMLRADLEKAKALETDLIAVMIHWGVEYQTTQNRHQDAVASFLLENGVDLVLGGHSHVPQPAGFQTVTLEDGTEHTGFVSYSLGNFISSQNDPLTDVTAVLTMELTKDMVTGETVVSGWKYQPMLMLDREKYPERFELLDVYRELERDDLSDFMRNKLEKALQSCHEILGQEYDAGQGSYPDEKTA